MNTISQISGSPQMTPKPTLMGITGCMDDIPEIGQDKQPKKNRCPFNSCNAKLGLASFPCKCGITFCAKHRQCEVHECTYDFKKAGMKMLSTQLVKVSGSRLQEKL